MRLDGSVSGWGEAAMAAAVLATAVYSWARYGIVPKREHLRDPRDAAYLAPWNVLSERKWTPDGLAFHRRVIAFSAKAVAGLTTLWLVLDALT